MKNRGSDTREDLGGWSPRYVLSAIRCVLTLPNRFGLPLFWVWADISIHSFSNRLDTTPEDLREFDNIVVDFNIGPYSPY